MKKYFLKKEIIKMVVEVEFRLQNPVAKSRLFFNYLVDRYASSIEKTEEDISHVSLMEKNIRIISNKFMKNGIKMTKENIASHNTKIAKIAISKEEIIDLPLSEDPIDEIRKKNSDFLIRRRKRHIISLNDDKNIFLHLTEVNENKYEIEVEKEYSFSEWESLDEDVEINFLTNFFEEWYQDEIYTPLSLLASFLKKFNEGVSCEPGKMSPSIISRARDLEKNDFITGKDGKKGLPEGYSLTIKGNGYPVLLFFNRERKALSKVLPEKSFHILGKDLPSLEDDFIVIGEFFEKHRLFVPFDILFSASYPLIRNIPNHFERMKIAEKLLLKNKNCYDSFFRLFIKNFTPIGKTPESFASAYKKVKAEIYPFENDGMILTPIYTSHNPPLQFGKERMLSMFPETCKIKPWEELSIDFRVDLERKAIFTHSSDSHSYRGTKKYPFDSEILVKWDTFPPETHEQVVELRPVRGEEDQIFFVFSRLREDKLNPNSSKVVDKVWKKINEPFEEALFLGTDFSRLRFQNNRIKRKLIESIPPKCVVVDIGTGKGGDILKYEGRAHTVLCIEPNEKNLSELKKRLTQVKKTLTTKFVILQCLGQDSLLIAENLREILATFPEKNQPPVVVSSMFSLTFFWKNRETLNAFEETLRSVARLSSEATFIFYTIEGKRFLRYFRQSKNNYIKSSGFRAKYEEDDKYGVGIKGKIKIEIYGTIVDEPQREYLVLLEDLKVLSNLKIEEGVIEPYLTEDERKYGNCSVYGTAKIRL